MSTAACSRLHCGTSALRLRPIDGPTGMVRAMVVVRDGMRLGPGACGWLQGRLRTRLGQWRHRLDGPARQREGRCAVANITVGERPCHVNPQSLAVPGSDY
jgi:hypothetical protein